MDMGKMAQMSAILLLEESQKVRSLEKLMHWGASWVLLLTKCTIQFRMLNLSKGPAMWSPRAQCDRMLYSSVMRSCLENTKNLHIWQDQVISLLFQNDIFLAFV